MGSLALQTYNTFQQPRKTWSSLYDFLIQILAKTNIFCCVVRVERSTDQVIKPVNVEALSKWVGKIPADVVRDMAVIAPMLSRLGYDPHANPPNYGRPDPKVLDNTRRVSAHRNMKSFFSHAHDIFTVILNGNLWCF